MSKSVIIVFVALMLPLAIYAQPGFGFGIKAGANFADQAVKDISTETITSFHGGAYLNLNFSESVGITPEVLFSANGSKWEDVKVNTDYITIPVMLRVKPVSLISLEAGPQFSFLTRAETEDIGDIKDQLKNNDFGLAFGGALQLPVGLQAGIRYVLGFTNISEVSEEEIKNRTFQIYLGWTILGAK
ncbi:MAG: PorT family protein [Bacteroidales bacterium]|nr:PorT family protein [Bacteroidales bacterium]